MNIGNFFKFLEGKQKKKMPVKARIFFDPTSFPSDKPILVKEDLFVRDESVVLPKNLYIHGNLTLDNNLPSSYKLPEELTVIGTLNMSGTDVELPKGLQVKALNMLYTGIKKLPNDIHVEELFAGYSELETIDNIKQKEFKRLRLPGTSIKSLPDGLTVDLLLDVGECPNLQKLPDYLTTGLLNIRDTPVREIPKHLNANELAWIRTPLYEKFTDQAIVDEIVDNGGSPPRLRDTRTK